MKFVTENSINNESNQTNESGFALLAVMTLILLMSIATAATYRILLLESLNTRALINQEIVFQATEKRLHECIEQIDLELPSNSMHQCCYIEKVHASKAKVYFRISVHLGLQRASDQSFVNPMLASQSRQQALIQISIDPRTHQIKKRDFLSWREILDHEWDSELDQSTNKPWEHINPCILNSGTTI